MEVSVLPAPLVADVVGVGGDQRRIGLSRIAHPDPHDRLVLDDRVRADEGLGGDAILARHLGAGARRVELEAVVEAAENVAIHMALAQGQGPVAAAVFDRADHAGRAAEEHDGLVQEAAGDALAGLQIGREARDIPDVAQKHVKTSPVGTFARAMMGEASKGWLLWQRVGWGGWRDPSS